MLQPSATVKYMSEPSSSTLKIITWADQDSQEGYILFSVYRINTMPSTGSSFFVAGSTIPWKSREAPSAGSNRLNMSATAFSITVISSYRTAYYLCRRVPLFNSRDCVQLNRHHDLRPLFSPYHSYPSVCQQYICQNSTRLCPTFMSNRASDAETFNAA